MEVYAAMIDQMDQGIGKVVTAIEQHGELDNTLIFYMHDNGGCAEHVGRGPKPNPRKDKPSFPPIPDDEVYYYSLKPKQTRDGWPVRTGMVMPGPADTYVAYGPGWATVSNTPFREYKRWVHEGGIASPLIVHWPAGIAEKNGIRKTPSHLIDIMATCVDVADASYPGEPIQPMEGKSLLPVFNNQPFERDMLFWEHEGNRALRMGKWKLVAKGLKGGWELYDIETDRGEQINLAAKQPERLKQMIELWEKTAHRTKVYPLPKKKQEAH
jgi:arylsulfatase